LSRLTLNWGNQDSPLDIASVFALLHPHAPNLVALKLIGGVLDENRLSNHLEKVAASLSEKLAGLTVDWSAASAWARWSKTCTFLGVSSFLT
jgi:hypothetical protein